MKRLFLLPLYIIILLVSCRNADTNPGKRVMTDSNIVVQEKTTQNGSERTTDNYSENLDKAPIPKIPMDPGQFIVTIIQTNLDLDTEDEQIIVHKINKGEDSHIIVDVIDFDSIRDKYVISWEYETQATNVRSFDLDLLDVTGDHNLEIVCRGSFGNDTQTLDILKRNQQKTSYGLLTYNPVLSLKEQGNIEIQQNQRSQAYKTGISNGKSFPVIAAASSSEVENRFDIIRKSYYWRNDEGTFSLINTEKIPGKQIEDSRLRAILAGTKNKFENFLSSMWILTSQNEEADGPLVLFELDKRKITFFENDIQEVYRWESSTKTLYNTLIINCRNDIVPYLKVTLYIRIADINTINLVYKDDSVRNTKKATNKNWSGKYLKTDKTLEDYLFNRDTAGENQDTETHLTGYYKSDYGEEIYFDPPRFELRKDGNIYKGGVYTFTIGVDVLQLKFINDNHEVVRTETYKYDFMVNKSDLEIVRTLVLIPGSINVTGFTPSGETFIRYEQIEQLEPEGSEANQ
ncbi:MAG: hypothetical protein DRP59_00045 [Spirochaetes bacterium]|nr:MAG: hypothetical protein DRP59_00045 [Spirochaetota bacterium]